MQGLHAHPRPRGRSCDGYWLGKGRRRLGAALLPSGGIVGKEGRGSGLNADRNENEEAIAALTAAIEQSGTGPWRLAVDGEEWWLEYPPAGFHPAETVTRSFERGAVGAIATFPMRARRQWQY
jgi:hypothetical protein